jgi:sensor domain CHASE-containing protein
MDSQTQGYLMALIFAAMGIIVMVLTWHRGKRNP